MKKLMFTTVLLAGSLTFMGCMEEDYGSLSCDESYEPECLGASFYRTCEKGTLTLTQCASGYICKLTNGVPACYDDKGNKF